MRRNLTKRIAHHRAIADLPSTVTRRAFRRIRLDAMLAVLLVMALLPWPATALELGQQADPTPTEALRVEVVEGEGSINNIRELLMRSPAVRVVDAQGKPVFGASVSFTTPAMGASAVFVDGSTQATLITNEKGLVRVEGMRPNNIVGSFEIRVVASFRNQRATARITQTNAAPAATGGGGGSKGLIILLVVAGAGAGVAAALGGGGGGNSPAPPTTPPPGGGTPPPTITITGGSPTFGAP
ncbi:MAG: Ig-like domain-containing protein [Bryobacterales bacterium]|jgi:hypothetical protein|nr:Ig-like domain-containing protein [Bryobacterales bacterium]